MGLDRESGLLLSGEHAALVQARVPYELLEELPAPASGPESLRCDSDDLFRSGVSGTVSQITNGLGRALPGWRLKLSALEEPFAQPGDTRLVDHHTSTAFEYEQQHGVGAEVDHTNTWRSGWTN
jgi:hypothetical protein